MKKIKTVKMITIRSTYDINDLYKYVEIIQNGKLKSTNIDFKDKKLTKKYGYPFLVNLDFLKLLKEDYFSNKNEIYKYLINNPTPEQIQDIDNYTIILNYGNGFMLFKNDENNNIKPIPMNHIITYINGRFLTNEYLEVDEFVKYLKSRDDVIYAKIEEIPYYNIWNSETKYISLEVLPSEEEYDKIYNISKSMKGFWEVEFLNLISGNNYKIYDFLGIEKYLKKKR